MIHMYWDRPACLITPSFGQKIIPLGISRNLTNTMIKLERLIGGKDHCIVLDSLEELARGVGRDPCSRFLSILLRRSREQNRTVLSFFKAGPFNYDPEHYLFRSFDNIFNVDKNGISEHSSNNLPQQKDPWQFNTAPAGSDTGTEMEKIKDIFRLTPEEQKELDEIVGERVREFSIS
ncbi:MAG: hypothetical protein JW705_08510 [Methanosarcinaceae archaeon]|nr:hypothetical protein [Methanosarcinaceae archaeon]